MFTGRGISTWARPFAAAIRRLAKAPVLAIAACAALAAIALGSALALPSAPLQAQSANSTTHSGGTPGGHMGVASCAGSTCHGRSVASGTPVRQDELQRWQEESSPAGAHSRAWRVIGEPRGAAIVRRLGLDGAGVTRECAGCHATAGSAHPAEGVDCEACHGNAGGAC